MGTVKEDAFCRSHCEDATNVTEEQKLISMHRSSGGKKGREKIYNLKYVEYYQYKPANNDSKTRL